MARDSLSPRPHGVRRWTRPGLTRLLAFGITLVTAVWRWRLVLSGWDPDTDSYAHHVIARDLVVDPWNHGLHWVWLPLFHWAQAALIPAGLDLLALRLGNVLIWAAVPLVTFQILLRSAAGRVSRQGPWVALVGAALTALCPLGMQMGTTAQTEPVFALLMVLLVLSLSASNYGWAALCLGAAALLRYEAWGITALLGVLALIGARLGIAWPNRGDPPSPVRFGWGLWVVVAAPTLAILAWAWLRVPFDGGRWFGFLADTRRFAQEATGARSSFELGMVRLLQDAILYPAFIPGKVFGPAVLLAPLGVPRLVRRHPWLALVGGTCLALITVSWLGRSSLGIERQFVAVIPAYAAAIALGLEVLVEWLVGPAPTAQNPRGRSLAENALESGRTFTLVALGLLLLGGTALGLRDWMREWERAIITGYPDRAAAGAFLRTLPPEQRLVCDEGAIEVMSGLPRQRFARHFTGSEAGRAAIARLVAIQGETHVATWASRAKPLLESGTVVFRAPKVGEDQVVILRLNRSTAQQ